MVHAEAMADFDAWRCASTLMFGRPTPTVPILRRQEKFNEALKDYSRAIRVDPNYAAAYVGYEATADLSGV